MSISNYLPSKKFSKVLVVLLVGGVIVLILSKSRSLGTLTSSKKTLTLTPEQIIEGDRDNDGLRDWEEALWGTNPDQQDTDKNGVSDLEEIEKKRQDIADQQGIDLSKEQENLNETDMFSRDIFASIISLKEKGALNQESIKSLADAAGKSFSGNMDLADSTQMKDIAIQSDDTLEQKKAYLKKFDLLMVSYQKKGVNSEYRIFSDYTLSDNKELLTELAAISPLYEQLSQEMKKVPVPSSIAQTHLDFINTTHKISEAMKNISTADNNELISTIGIAQYKEQNTNYIKLLNIYTDLISTHGIL